MKDRPLTKVWYVNWFELTSHGVGGGGSELYAEWPDHLPRAPKKPDGFQRTSSLQDPSFVQWEYRDSEGRYWHYSAILKEVR